MISFRFKLLIAVGVLLLGSMTLAAIHDTSPGAAQDFLSDIPINVSGGSVDLLLVRKLFPASNGKHRGDKATFNGLQVVGGGDVFYGFMPNSGGIKLTVNS